MLRGRPDTVPVVLSSAMTACHDLNPRGVKTRNGYAHQACGIDADSISAKSASPVHKFKLRFNTIE